MIRKILLLLTLVVLPIGYTCLADDSEKTPIDFREKKPRPSQRPKAPSAQCIMATVSNGVLFVDFAISEGDAVMTICCQENTIMEYLFDTSAPAAVTIGELHDFQISIATSMGNCYESDIIASSI